MKLCAYKVNAQLFTNILAIMIRDAHTRATQNYMKYMQIKLTLKTYILI